MLVAQSCPTLCNHVDCSPPGFQTRILEWVAISFSRGSSWPRDWTWVSCIAGRFFTRLSQQRSSLSQLDTSKPKTGGKKGFFFLLAANKENVGDLSWRSIPQNNKTEEVLSWCWSRGEFSIKLGPRLTESKSGWLKLRVNIIFPFSTWKGALVHEELRDILLWKSIDKSGPWPKVALLFLDFSFSVSAFFPLRLLIIETSSMPSTVVRLKRQNGLGQNGFS